MNKVMMQCGHAANAQKPDGSPACAICAGLNPGADVVAFIGPNLTGRQARCSCGRTEPSSIDLAFFEFRGAGSRAAMTSCKNCAYARVAHDPEVRARNKALKCVTFEAHGAFEFDDYYCGHAGWD